MEEITMKDGEKTITWKAWKAHKNGWMVWDKVLQGYYDEKMITPKDVRKHKAMINVVQNVGKVNAKDNV